MTDDLLAKLEAATEGSRELDAHILAELEGPDWVVENHYTTSIDVALTLVPEGFKPRLDFDLAKRCYLCPESELTIGAALVYADSHTMPLAICIAALKARKAP